jgi:hypothetical protein
MKSQIFEEKTTFDLLIDIIWHSVYDFLCKLYSVVRRPVQSAIVYTYALKSSNVWDVGVTA